MQLNSNNIKILFPCNPINNSEVDPDFSEELSSAKTHGFDYILYDHDLLVKADTNFMKISESENPTTVILRGYMLKEAQYHLLYNHLKDYNYILVNSLGQYLNCHYFPYSYESIKEFSNRIWFSDEYDSEWIKSICELDSNLIIKDFVKSEKGTDLFFINKGIKQGDLSEKIKSFIEMRGSLFNKGIQFKEYLNLKKYDDCINEWRLFVLNGELVSMSRNSKIEIESARPNIPDLKEIIDRLSVLSNFLTFDIVELETGEFKVIETGDGSVSGLSPDQNSLAFYAKIKEIMRKDILFCNSFKKMTNFDNNL